MVDTQTLLTAEGYAKLETELQDLKKHQRKAVAEKLAEAIAQGDLSENAEYDAAKNEQATIEGRIKEIEELLKTAVIIEEGLKSDTVQLGSTVKLRFEDTGEEAEYSIVGTTEADALSHRISNECPVGEALMGASKGSKVSVTVEGKAYEYTVLALS
ncbi:transcription elongation factor GreA [Candidatus Peribacteria bacterium]|nr:transcription elongation factor GreA [Candidatus Peribacteria bacterium]